EDGIRDRTVTGVQTCALPIWRIRALAALASELSSVVTQPLKAVLKKQLPEGRTLVERLSEEVLDVSALRRIFLRDIAISDQTLRSEERRVGKECSDGVV